MHGCVLVLVIAAMLPAVEGQRQKQVAAMLQEYESATAGNRDTVRERLEQEFARYQIREAVPVIRKLLEPSPSGFGIWSPAFDDHPSHRPNNWRPSIAETLGAIGTPEAIDLLIKYMYMPGAATALSATLNTRALVALHLAANDWWSRCQCTPEIQAEICVASATAYDCDFVESLLKIIEDRNRPAAARRCASAEFHRIPKIDELEGSISWSHSPRPLGYVETPRLVAIFLTNLDDPFICWFCAQELKDRPELGVSQLLAGYALDLDYSAECVKTGTGPVPELMRERAKALGVPVAKLFEGATPIGFAPPSLSMLRYPVLGSEMGLPFFPVLPKKSGSESGWFTIELPPSPVEPKNGGVCPGSIKVRYCVG